jgi:hypothetical protein
VNGPTALERLSAQASVSPRVIAALVAKDVAELRQGRIALTLVALSAFRANHP